MECRKSDRQNHVRKQVGKFLHRSEQKSYKRRLESVALLNAMTTARSLIIQPGQLGHFHCTVRCVQQMFLCGRDRATGKSFEHRRRWIEQRMFALGEIFAVSVHSFAVMSNHYHLVLTVDPEIVQTWDDWEVAKRGVELYRRANENEDHRLARALVWRDWPEQIAKLRQRLGTLGEYMKALNEFTAKAANRESGRKGNFWDDRYGCVALLDDAALLAAMVYVDLNPIRAAMAPTLLDSDHTSAQLRLKHIRADRRRATDPLLPVAGPAHRQLLDMDSATYLDLADQTGRQLHPGKRGRIQHSAPPVLQQIGLNQPQWLVQVRGIESRYWRAVGSVDALICLAERLGQQWVRGLVSAKALERMR